MHFELGDGLGEETLNLEAARLQGSLKLERRILAHVRGFLESIRARPMVDGIDLRVVVPVQNARHAGEAGDIRGGNDEPSPADSAVRDAGAARYPALPGQ